MKDRLNSFALKALENQEEQNERETETLNLIDQAIRADGVR
jgi:hypothetical protein